MNKSESLTWSPPLSPVGILSSVAILRLPANFASYPRVGTDTPPQVLALGEQPSPITSLRSLSALTTENLRVCACVCVCVCVCTGSWKDVTVLCRLILQPCIPQHLLCSGWAKNVIPHNTAKSIAVPVGGPQLLAS